jgi:catechol 2,3-dioxygenase-like lactoylglutathione lyase family enzyme
MRHRVNRLIAACVFAFVVVAQIAHAQVRAVQSISMTVEDMDRSIDFYTRVLDFRKTSDNEVAGEQFERLYGVFGVRCRVVTLQLGDESIELIEFLAPRGGRLIPRDSRANDRWFQHIAIVVTDMDRAYARLREHKVRHASSGPQELPSWTHNAGGIKAFYFRDPDDHTLELIYFPAAKGDSKWQGKRELFAGIDHTAIVVSNTEDALKFYRDTLGMTVAGTSENYGIEQARQNNVEGAHLRITGLRAKSGPGVEFLEYLAPRDGRPYPIDAKKHDLFAWHTTLFTADVAGLIADVKAKGYTIVTRGATDKHVIVRDADGHLLEFRGE